MVESVDTSLVKVKNPKLVWLASNSNYSNSKILENIYIKKDNKFFGNIEVYENQCKTFNADRYGGYGIGKNGGSGRTAVEKLSEIVLLDCSHRQTK